MQGYDNWDPSYHYKGYSETKGVVLKQFAVPKRGPSQLPWSYCGRKSKILK